MKYRILIKSVNVNVSTYNWYAGSSGSTPYETEDEQEALQEYQILLQTHSSGNLTLIQVVPVTITVSV